MVRLERRARRFLRLATIAPLFGATIVLLFPPSRSGYLLEQAFLLFLALGALFVSRARPALALWFYCALALGPVGMMIARYEQLNGGFNPWVLTPHAGIVVVALVLKSERATLTYSLLAWAVSGWYGWLCNDVGQSGWGMMLAAIVSLCSSWWLDDENVKEAAETINIVKRGLSSLWEALDGRSKRA